jgi:heat shock protein HtpX
MNYLKTTILLAVMTGLFLAIGNLLGGHKGMVIAFIAAIVMNFSAYWFSDKMVLNTYGARAVTQEEAPELYEIVRNLTQKANLPMPAIYIMEDDNPNAFATGRNTHHAAVAVTTGILKILNYDELTGVLAHELSHVRHRDILISTIAATLGGAITMIAQIAQWGMLFGRSEGGEGRGALSSLLMIILAPIAATLIQLAVSRSREYGADEGGAKLSGKPLALASALRKLETVNEQVPLPAADENPSSAHLFIINPLRPDLFQRMFSTHPSTEDRIRRLEAMAAGKW